MKRSRLNKGAKARKSSRLSTIVHVLNGKRYVSMDAMVTSENNEEIVHKAKKLGAIQRAVKKAETGGLFGQRFMVVEFLVPEKNIEKWSK